MITMAAEIVSFSKLKSHLLLICNKSRSYILTLYNVTFTLGLCTFIQSEEGGGPNSFYTPA